MLIQSIMILLGGGFSILSFYRYRKTGNKWNRNTGIVLIILTEILGAAMLMI